jgi:hypothetical protein
VLVALLPGANPAAAQPDNVGADPAAVTAATAILSQDETGRRIVRAVRIREPIRIDGQLDDAAYRDVPPITEFIQQVPKNGAPVSERTEMWVLFDDDNIYISCRCLDQNPDRIVANDMRRDSSGTGGQDNLTVAFDTFNDQRSGFMFTLTASGGLRDGTATTEGSNFDWNTVFDGSASRSDQGWIAEMAIPFKSLRYAPGREQTWGVQIRRRITSKNEMAYVTLVSPAWNQQAVHHFDEAATLVGLEAPPAARNLEIKPYAMSRVTTDRLSRPALDNDVDPDAGFDLKYGLTKSLTADFTYNTDFAQVEADEAQVNLTRFSLVFPEKREFFLEGGDIFAFGRNASGDLGGDAPSVFYSRRIGLSGARVVPVMAGGRITGKAGPWSIGGLNIETNDDPDAGIEQTNFAVVRLRRDILRRSNVGALFTNRSVSTTASGSNQVWGADANFAFFQSVFLSGYLAKSQTEGRSGDDLNYRAQFNYNADRYGLALDRLVVEKNFNPEVGFMRRENFRRNLARARFSPRTAANRIVRKLTYEGTFDYVTDNENHLESRELSGRFQTDFHNSDTASVEYSQLYEFIPEPFSISRGVRIAVGGYSFDNLRLSFTGGSQRRINGTATFDVGSFYDGDKTTAAFRGRVEITKQLGLEPNISLNWIDLPQGSFTNTVVGGRTVFTMTPRMFVAALVQYSSSNTSLSTNLRFRWEYQPGSELFVVYTEGRSTLPPRGTDLENRGFVVKINRLFRF